MPVAQRRRPAVSHLRMPAAVLPLDLLAHVLRRACEELISQQCLARLVQLACVSRHWRAAAGPAAEQTSNDIVSLPCRCLTPLLGSWATRWTGLELILDDHGVQPGLQAFMCGSAALHSVTVGPSIYSEAFSLENDTVLEEDLIAVLHALAVAPALQSLTCPAFIPAVLPKSLERLEIGYVKWADEELEDYFLHGLQLLPRLREIEIYLGECWAVLSVDRLSGLVLPSLQCLKLDLGLADDLKAFDMSWLSSKRRSFKLILVMSSYEKLLDFSNRLLPVLQPQDHLILEAWRFSSEALEVLSALKLGHLHIDVPADKVITALPVATTIHLNFSLERWALVRGSYRVRNPPERLTEFVSQLHWQAVVSASREFKVTCDTAGAPAACSKQLHVVGVPAQSWQDSLAEPEQPWQCRVLGWDSLSGMPAATRKTDAEYVLMNRAAEAVAARLS